MVALKPRLAARWPVLLLALVSGVVLVSMSQPLLATLQSGARAPPAGEAYALRLATYEQRAESFPVTETLWQRIPPAVIEEDRATHAICPDCPADVAPEAADNEYKRLFIGHAVHTSNLSDVFQLADVQPPEDTHAMSRGVGFVTGGLYESDYVATSVQAATGTPFGVVKRAVLDFGGSSGRVVRTMKAAFPANTYHLCDPNRKSILWARKNIPHINAFVSPNAPPLPLDAGAIDLVYAVSIWSHYAERLALLWLEEMRRILKPGGLLYITTHGFQAVRHYSATKTLPRDNLAKVEADLKGKGYHFDNFFGANGDWGVINSEWGHSYLSPAWLERAVAGKFGIAHYCVGCEQNNQDIWVLVRL